MRNDIYTDVIMPSSYTPEFKFAIREDLKDTGDIFLPTRGEGKASGWDVRAAQEDRKPIIIKAGQYVRIPLGFRAFCPEGWYYRLNPRSSTFAKKHLNCLYGVIDETYALELVLAVQYIPSFNLSDDSASNPRLAIETTDRCVTINFGDAIGQIIPVYRQEMMVTGIDNETFEALCVDRNAERKGGFGSTG